jgi:hypothetical protein
MMFCRALQASDPSGISKTPIPRVAKNDVVDEIDPHQDAGRYQPARQHVIVVARCRIARWMIVESDHAARLAENRLAEDVPRMHHRRVERSRGDHDGAKHAAFRVEQHETEVFDRPRSERGQEIHRGLMRTAEPYPRARRVRERAASQLERGQQLRRFGVANPAHSRQVADGRPSDTMHAAARREQLVGDVEGTGTTPAAAEDERDELVVSERRHAARQQLLARPIVGRQRSHRAEPPAETRILLSMPLGRLARLCLLALSISFAGCGGEPPNKEIQEARNAIERAKAAGADRYAAEEYTAAVDALQQADNAVSQRDFRLALSHALDSKERADTATTEAGSKQVAARADAEKGLFDARSSLERARAKLKAVEAGRTVPSPALAAPRASLITADEHLQEASNAFAKNDYISTNTATVAAMQAISAADQAIDAASPPAARRRR